MCQEAKGEGSGPSDPSSPRGAPWAPPGSLSRPSHCPVFAHILATQGPQEGRSHISRQLSGMHGQ